jgi:DNA-binding transcriptional ArsR family regulator
VKPITEIDDPRLVKALAHPLRVHILRVLQDRVASPSELASELDVRLTNLSYHVRFLERLELLELVSTKPRRGAVEHYYRARGRLRITDKAWAQVPAIVKNAMVAATLDQTTRYVHAAASTGGLDHQLAHLCRQPMVLDEAGFKELAVAVKQLLERANGIEAGSAKRLAAHGAHEAHEIEAGLVMMLFEAQPSRTGVPIAEHAETPRARR